MHISWDPLIPAAVTAAFAGGFYLYGKLPRVTAFFAAATLAFLASGTGLLALAHKHPVGTGPWQVAIILGAALGLVLFFFIVLKGHHKHPLIKGRRSAGGAGTPGAAGVGSKGHPKAPHHRAMGVTVMAMAFSFLLAINFSGIWHAGSGGLSQTGSGITTGNGSK